MITEFKYFKEGKPIILGEKEKQIYEPTLLSTVENFKDVWPHLGDSLEVMSGPLMGYMVYFCGVSLTLNLNSPAFPDVKYLCKHSFDFPGDCEVFTPVIRQIKKVWH